MSRLSARKLGIMEFLEPYWPRIRRAVGRVLKIPASKVLPAKYRGEELGCGAFGCVWQTADARFVVKATLDATEGGLIASIMADPKLRKHPGVAYYRALWQLPDYVWTDRFGSTPIYVMIREEADVDSTYGRAHKPAKTLKKVYNVLEEYPDLASDLVFRISDCLELGTEECFLAQEELEEEIDGLLTRLQKTKGKRVGEFLEAAYKSKRKLLLGDIHYDNVGFRRHNLREFGVPRHKDLIVTDLGDIGQPPITEDKHPRIKILNNPYGHQVQVPVL